jgi:hypothetical protein
MAPKDLRALREGHTGIALVLYIDMEKDKIEESWQGLPEVLAIDADGGRRVLDLLKAAIQSGKALPVTDSAASSLSLMLATGMEWQAFLEPMLEGIAGKPMVSPLQARAD